MYQTKIYAPALLVLAALLMSGFMDRVSKISVQVENVAQSRGVVRLAVFATEADFTAQKNPRCQLDLSPREYATFAPLVLLTIWMGVYPSSFLNFFEATVAALIERHEAALGAARLAGM